MNYKILLIEFALRAILKALQGDNKTAQKIKSFLVEDKTQSTIGTIFTAYNELVDELED